jgi:hypothetical protein
LSKDPVEARFQPCFLPVIEVVPAAAIVITLILLLLKPAWNHRPRWLHAFVEEDEKSDGDLPSNDLRSFDYRTGGLLLATLFGLIFQTLSIFFPERSVTAAYSSATWVRSGIFHTSSFSG